jgi:hypothetical protein
VEAVGAYPVFAIDRGEFSLSDYKSKIAFNGRTVRAAEQARFYPTPIDAAGAPVSQVRFDVEVRCSRCRSLYMNGALPQAGPTARFRSDVPRDLLLYSGDFEVATVGGVHFLGAPVSADTAVRAAAAVGAIREALEGHMGMPLADTPSFLSFSATRANPRPGSSPWGFLTWPTIASDGGLGFDQLLQIRTGTPPRFEEWREPFLAHELGHYYFGARFQPRGPLRWFLLESTAEYLAYAVVSQLGGERAAAEMRKDYLARVGNAARFTPLDEVVAEAQIGETYRYQLGPLLLIALENKAGRQPLMRALASFPRDPLKGPATYKDFRSRLRTNGISETALDHFAKECLVKPIDWSLCLSTRSTGRLGRRLARSPRSRGDGGTV